MKMKYVLVIFCFLVSISVTFFFDVFSIKGIKKEVLYRGNRYLVSVDGKDSSMMPNQGNYYLVDYDCSSKNTKVSWDRENYQLMVSNGKSKGGVSCSLHFESYPKLVDMPVGSFVSYVGSNGCVGDSCSGENANSRDSFLGYCGNADSEFYYDGFRIAYSMDGSAYLVSAGALECVDAGGKSLDNIALKYCNSNFVHSGICNSDTVFSIRDTTFSKILSRNDLFSNCFGIQSKKCGYLNDMVDIGSDYWYSYQDGMYYWSSSGRFISDGNGNNLLGVRPIIRMDNSVIVVGGDGSYDSPYQISNRTFFVGSYDKEKSRLGLKMSGYQVSEMCINLNSTVCTNYVPYDSEYSLDVSRAIQGENIVYVYYKNSNGDIVSVLNREFVLES